MKILIVICSLAVLASAEISTSNKYEMDLKSHFNSINVRHHEQHSQSVNTAKSKLQDQLSAIGVQFGNSYASSGSQRLNAGCTTCYDGGSAFNSRHSSSSSSHQSATSGSGASGTEYSGVGTVARLSDRYTNDDDFEDNQKVVRPTYLSNSRHASSAYEAEDMQQRHMPVDLSNVQSSAYRSASKTEYDENDLQQTVGHDYQPVYNRNQPSRISTVPSYVSSRSQSASERSESSRTGSVMPTHVSSGSQQQQHQLAESQLSETRRPVGQTINIRARPGTATYIGVPVGVVDGEQQSLYTRVADASESSSRVSSSQNPSAVTYRVTYSPVFNQVTSDKLSASSDSEYQRTVGDYQQPERLQTYSSFNAPESSSHTRSRTSNSESQVESSQQRVAPIAVSSPTYGGSSRYHSTGSSNLGHTQARVQPLAVESSSSSSSRTAEEREQRRYVQPQPSYQSSSRSSDHEETSSRNQAASSYRPSYVSTGSNTGSQVLGSSGSLYYAPSRSQSQSQASSSSQQRQSAQFSPYQPSSRVASSAGYGSSTSDRLSQRFGSGVQFSSSDDLQEIMSESEKQARLQQQQVAGSSRNVVNSNSEANRRTLENAANLDAQAAKFVGKNSHLATRIGGDAADLAGNGGFSQVRSWNRQSKWSSGSEYGPDGKPKTYSTLSTGEAEKYNINGAEAGYKAATTTLENDGKVSTYSVHT